VSTRAGQVQLRFLGNLVANLAFHPEYDRAHANHLIKIAEELTYQQLCILSLAGSEDFLRVAPGQEDQDRRPTRVEQIGLMTEIYDLCQRQMLIIPNGDTIEFPINEIVPFTLTVGNTGASLYTLMELGSMDNQDLAPLIRLLQ
jgi:hypothetical protein